MDSIEKDLRDTGICYRHDIPYIDFKCLRKVFSKMDVQKLIRFIKKGKILEHSCWNYYLPTYCSRFTSICNCWFNLNISILPEFPDNQIILDDENHDHITLLEYKLMQMRYLHRDIESMLKANLDKLRTFRNLYSAVLSVENKSCGVGAFEEILNDVPKVMLHSYFSPLAGVVSGGVTCVRQLIKYFSNSELRAEQKRLLLELIENLDQDLMKCNHGIESKILQITNG